MANIRIDLNRAPFDGETLSFKAPCDAKDITGLIIYYPNENAETVSQEFTLNDASGSDIGEIDSIFSEGSIVKVIIDTDVSNAYVQNPDTNAYLEDRFENKAKKEHEHTADKIKFSDGSTFQQKYDRGELKGPAGSTPEKGVDYWTPEDQESIVQDVILALGMPVFGSVTAENDIMLTGALAVGTYAIKFEDENGRVAQIGNLTLRLGPLDVPLTWEHGVELNKENGTVYSTSSPQYSASGYIEIDSDKTYTVTRDSCMNNACSVIWYDADGKFISCVSNFFANVNASGDADDLSYQLVPPANAAKFRLRLWHETTQDAATVAALYKLAKYGVIVDDGTVDDGTGDDGTGDDGSQYTNVLPLAIDKDGTVYNGTGYKVGARIGSSGTVGTVSNASATNPIFLTGYIQVPAGATIRMKNCFIDTDGVNGTPNDTADKAYYGHNMSGLYGCITYNDLAQTNFNADTTNYTWQYFNNYSLLASTPTVDSNGYITEFTLNTTTTQYIRMHLGGDPTTAVITINEEITD